MTDDARPDPDALLASIQRECQTARRGKLKIFFGMCPGVGKTYTMLQAAHKEVAAGIEVLVGVVETHGRAETQAMLEGLAICPKAQIEYRGVLLEEMDLDAILAWHPPLVLVDELAHTNAAGSRHPKRYQDVLELLDAGMDVWTTLNVQHVESRADAVQQITGVAVRETVPDSVLDRADQMVLVDLPPGQLRSRLAEGRVYRGESVAAASDHFFKESNLTALREMSLRYVAEHVDRDLREIMRNEAIAGPWKSGDRLLVAVSPSPFSEKLVRYARRLAGSMEAAWIAVHIDNGRPLDEAEQVRLTRHLTLARQLGAEVISTSGTDVAGALLRIAREHNVTQIILGKPLDSPWMRWFGKASPVDWLIRHSGEIDIHMIRSEALERAPRSSWSARVRRQSVGEWGLTLAVAVGMTLLCLVLQPWLGYRSMPLIYLLGVVVAAMWLGRWPTLFLAALSALLWDFLFVPPQFTLSIHELHDFLMFGTFFVVATVVGHVTARLREREQLERRGEERSTALYRLASELAAGGDPESALRETLVLTGSTFGTEAVALLRGGADLDPHPAGTLTLSAKEESVAAWAFQKKRAAGRFTDTLPDAGALHIPLLAGDRAVGVLVLQLHQAPSVEQRELLDAFAAQIAIFLEKEEALQSRREAHLAASSEKLQRTLFDSVSHELKTPLAAISAALEQPQPDRAELIEAVRRLSKTVDDLLDVTRLESGLLQPTREWCDPGELVREALAKVAPVGRAVTTHIAPGLTPFLVDPGFVAQALVTLISNALTYSPANSPVEIHADRDDRFVVFTVADRGPGLASGEEVRVFEKFYRGAGVGPGGLGLGLAIARQLVQVQDGSMTAQRRQNGGAVFTIRLPAGEPMQLPPETPS